MELNVTFLIPVFIFINIGIYLKIYVLKGIEFESWSIPQQKKYISLKTCDNMPQ